MFRYPMIRRSVLLLWISLLLFTGITIQAQDTAVWFAEYYDNQYLIGEPKIRRQEGALFFDWGIHSPGEGIPADGFSARFGADPYLSGGTYRFEFSVDDAINFYVDRKLVLTTYDRPQPGQTLYTELQLAEGVHHFQVDYREVSGFANLRLNWYNITRPPAPISYPADQLVEGNIVAIPDRWYAQFYTNQTLSGAPQVTQTSEPINRDWGDGRPQTGIPTDHWSARFSINHTLGGGRYTASVRVHHDDGVRVIVSGQTWVDTWGHPRGETITATRDLPAGPHTFVIEYNDDSHFAFLEFQLKREGPGSAPPPSTGPAVVQAPRPAATPFIDVITYGQGRVTAGRLNVRPFPDTRDAPRLGVTTYGRFHPIVGRNVDGSWYQIVSNGRLGWVYARYLELDTTARDADIPITNQSAVALRTETGYQLIAKGRASIRSYPSEGEALLGTLPDGAEAAIVGRTEEWGWWQIQYDGMQGWVAAEDVRVDTRLLLKDVPIAGE